MFFFVRCLRTPTFALGPADEQQLGLTGGKSIRCTKGVYFAEQGVGACADIGTSQFRLSDGIVVSNTASITRGFKDGYNIMQTGSKGISYFSHCLPIF